MKPEPVVTGQVCSVCGLPWDQHGESPAIEKCIELLKAALTTARASRPIWSTSSYDGYRCPICNGWVSSGAIHACGALAR